MKRICGSVLPFRLPKSAGVHGINANVARLSRGVSSPAYHLPEVKPAKYSNKIAMQDNLHSKTLRFGGVILGSNPSGVAT